MRRTSFNEGWETRTHVSFFLEMVGAAAPWQPVTLPHDAALGRRDPTAGAGSGYVPSGVYEYRTTLPVPAEYRDRRVLLELPLRPLADTIAVLDTMDEVRRQLAAGAAERGGVS